MKTIDTDRDSVRESAREQPLSNPGDLAVILDASGSPSSRLRGRFVAHVGEGGLKLEVAAALGPGTAVSIAGQIATPEGMRPLLGQYRVSACVLAGIGKYHANLTPSRPQAKPEEPKEAPRTAPANAEVEDCYRILQVSRTAETDTIHRVFHVLAQRYHPDNRETGEEERFRQLVEAHSILTDPERRAAHDVHLASEDRVKLRIFDSLESTQGVQAEIRKRHGVLRLLYAKRITSPHQPAMRGREFADLLGCPTEHLEFTLWYLRENRWLIRTDNNNFEITVQGVEEFERQEQTFQKKQPLPLPAPAFSRPSRARRRTCIPRGRVRW
jgi:curved DNA-binding protein CbpA